jgi:hypothetical protein
MRNLLLAAAGAAVLAVAPAAHASAVITLTPRDSNGGLSGTFGDDGVSKGPFGDEFDFFLPEFGKVTATISSTAVGPSSDIDFSEVTFNGMAFHTISTGVFELRVLDPTAVTGGTQHLVVKGLSAGNGSYAGTLSFAADPVTGLPEPAAWALMISGFGGAGAMIRRRRRAANFA